MNLYNFLHYINIENLIFLNYKGRYLSDSPTTPHELLKDDFTKKFNVIESKTESWKDTTILIIDIV